MLVQTHDNYQAYERMDPYDADAEREKASDISDARDTLDSYGDAYLRAQDAFYESVLFKPWLADVLSDALHDLAIMLSERDDACQAAAVLANSGLREVDIPLSPAWVSLFAHSWQTPGVYLGPIKFQNALAAQSEAI